MLGCWSRRRRHTGSVTATVAAARQTRLVDKLIVLLLHQPSGLLQRRHRGPRSTPGAIAAHGNGQGQDHGNGSATHGSADDRRPEVRTLTRIRVELDERNAHPLVRRPALIQRPVVYVHHFDAADVGRYETVVSSSFPLKNIS